jgi:hypothetical protein
MGSSTSASARARFTSEVAVALGREHATALWTCGRRRRFERCETGYSSICGAHRVHSAEPTQQRFVEEVIFDYLFETTPTMPGENTQASGPAGARVR